MENIRVLVWEYTPNRRLARDFVSRCIVYFTGMFYTHVAIWVDGVMYDSSVWKDKNGKTMHGARAKVGTVEELKATGFDAVLYPEGITRQQVDKVRDWCTATVSEGKPYNFLKLGILALVYPTRWFWNLIRWVSFSAEVFGKVCSTYVDEALYQSGYDVFTDYIEEFTVPGDFIFSDSKLTEV
jgi:hypothetical protein